MQVNSKAQNFEDGVPTTVRPADFFNEESFCQQTDLEKLLHSAEFNENMTFSIKNKPINILLILLKFSVSNVLTFSATSQLLKLVNNLLGKPILPDTPHFINKYFNPNLDTEYHGMCSNRECLAYLGKIESFNVSFSCRICGEVQKLSKTSYKNFFAIIDPSVSIQKVINRYDQYYDDVMENRLNTPGVIKDIFDGAIYKEFVSNLPDSDKKNYVSCLVNTDGASPDKSTTKSLWPIYLSVNEIPVCARYKNVITCGLWFGKGKPNMLMYLTPFVDLFNNKLSKIGIDCEIKGEKRNLKVYCINCTVDNPCRAAVQGVKQFNGKYGCNWCLIPGVMLDTNRYSLLQCNDYTDRDPNSTIEHMRAIARSTNWSTEDGVVSVSALINLANFNIVNGFTVDYMHAALLGVGAQVTELILRTLTLRDIEVIDQNLLSIKIPYQLCRMTRSIKERNLWKAKEWEAWILFYSIPLLSKVAHSSLVAYWSLFVRSLYILLSTEVS